MVTQNLTQNGDGVNTDQSPDIALLFTEAWDRAPAREYVENRNYYRDRPREARLKSALRDVMDVPWLEGDEAAQLAAEAVRRYTEYGSWNNPGSFTAEIVKELHEWADWWVAIDWPPLVAPHVQAAHDAYLIREKEREEADEAKRLRKLADDEAAREKKAVAYRAKIDAFEREFASAPIDYGPEAVVKGFCRRTKTAHIAGPDKTMKSWRAGELIGAATTGTEVLGMAVAKVPAVYLTLETSKADATARIEQSIGGRGGAAARFYVMNDPHVILDDDGREGLTEFLIARDVGLVVLDPQYILLRGRARMTDMSSVGAALEWLTRPITDANASAVVVHHFTKDNNRLGVPPELDDLSGAGVGAFTDGWLLVNREAEYVPGTGIHNLLALTGCRGSFGAKHPLRIDEGAGTLTVATSGKREEPSPITGPKVPACFTGKKKGG